MDTVEAHSNTYFTFYKLYYEKKYIGGLNELTLNSKKDVAKLVNAETKTKTCKKQYYNKIFLNLYDSLTLVLISISLKINPPLENRKPKE